MKKLYTCLLRSALLIGLLTSFGWSVHATDPKAYAVEVSATVQAAPAQINLQWVGDANATSYSVYRKAPAATSWTLLTALGGTASSWADVSVANGGSYEYNITKATSAGYTGTGYLLAGINAPLVERRGKVVLIVDNTYAASLSTELTCLQQDLVGDGWTVLRHDVSRSDSVVSVKNLIKADYNADPSNVKSVFLFGHVPVAYSGDLTPPPDGHSEHAGAWPADAYYGDMDSAWTDSTANDTSGTLQRNWNMPGDGKFDQTDLPSDVELQVGRVDLSNLTCFANKTPARSELDLLRAYLNKDHAFRVGQVVVPRRGLVVDTFGDIYNENFASSGWRNSAAFFGAANTTLAPYNTYFSTLQNNGYLWSYGDGGGTFTSCDGIGTSDNFATTDIKTVFTAFVGSYFGDWDNESNFLRAALGSGDCLTAAWDGRPHWFFHHMTLGETVGYSARISQNNAVNGLYSGWNWGTHRVHIALMGDPTLRLHPVIQPANVTAVTAVAGNGVSITWTASTDANIQGYVVDRGSSLNGPFSKISGSSLLTSLGMTDPAGSAGSVYMVRAVKLEQSGGGTYFNPSVGVIATATAPAVPPPPTPTVPAAPSNLNGSAGAASQVTLSWTDNASNESGFTLMRKIGAGGAYASISLGANATSYSDSGLSAGTQYYYKVAAWNSVGTSAYSTEISVTTQPVPTTPPAGAGAIFVQTDTTTGGLWKGNYGTDGEVVVGDSSALPASALLSYSAERQGWVWADPALDSGSLTRAGSSARIAACWYSPTEFSTSLRFSDGQTHRVAFYFLDWDKVGRQQTMELYDADSGTLISSRLISGFGAGAYSVWDLKGNIRLRLVRVAGPNCVLGGIFFAPGGSTTPTPTPTPAPTPSAGNAARYLGLNLSTQGSWKGAFGSQGFQLMQEGSSLPNFASVSPAGNSTWTWLWDSTDAAALQKMSAADRLAACYYSATSFDLNVSITDGQTHKVSFYCLDWDSQNRTQRVDVLDAATGANLGTANLWGFQKGQYVSFDVKGSVVFRFTRTGPFNSVVSGIFFDAPSAPL